MRAALTGILLLALAACGESSAPPRDFGPVVTVAGHFGAAGEASEDVSGLACDWQAAGGGEMRCLAIEDEEAEAQWAAFGNDMLRAGRRFALLGPERPLGTPPSGICGGGISGDGELDGEAAAFSDGAYYVTGSHGCSRNNDEFDAASFLVVRITPDDQPGTDVAPGTVAVEQSYRLSGLLRRAPELAGYFGARLEGGNGLNIEGLAVDGDRMIFGLRAPAVNGTAFLFETSATALFSREIAGTGRAIPLALDPDEGVRDLAFLPGGRLLILTGPAQNQDIAYRILLRGEDGGLAPLATVSAPYEGKAEAIAVIGLEGNRLSLLVLFDGVNDGAPQRLTLDLPG
ncbi:DUF3616 domain-containing protein [Parasphingopyxis marina]|uniref:DUF3616 domain-containing protein n=1 Tax=Parasphingopyxis marina TaxID=2761622 RepID=A0A842HVR6_9SPHN|nr:DUF3616 domain-containing protein [Parasphingopyxis marina]MBC2776461.1 DUF3616 domain-containing protein [Parasphingopyxis marina]